MIAALKQYGTNVAKNTARRLIVRYAVFGVLVVVGLVYQLVTGKSILKSDDESAPPPTAPAPATPAPAAPAAAKPAAPITTPAQAAVVTPAGIDINAPKRAAQAAAAATNAHIAAETEAPVAVATTAPVSGPGSAPSGALPAPVAAADAAPANASGMTREMYGYGAVGRRDPFFSLLLTDDLRPLLADLRLVGILYEQSGRRAVAVMRDVQTNAQYRVANGGTLGRMRVIQIRPRAVLFSIDEFGLSRQDSLVWSDSTKVRN